MFVGGLPPGVGAAEVRGRFAAFGEVGEVVLPPAEAMAGDGGGHRGFAFFDLRADSVAVQRCISIYNGCDWAGHRMCVAQARERWTARFEREAAQDVSSAAELQMEQERKRSAAAAGGLGAALRPMLLGRGPSGKRLKVRPDGGDDKHRRHRTFFPPGRPRGPVSWECQSRQNPEERHRRALGLKSESPASFVLPSRPHAPAYADAGSELQRLLEEGREYVDSLGFPEDDVKGDEPGEEAPEAGRRGTEELLAHHGYRSDSEGDETGGDSGGRGGSPRSVPTSSEEDEPRGRGHRLAGASGSGTGSENESEHRGSEEPTGSGEATDSDSPSSPEVARSAAAPEHASPRERSSSLHDTTTSSFLSSSSGLENELDSMAAAQADRDPCPGVAHPGGTAAPQAEEPTRADSRGDLAAAPSSSTATTTTTTNTTSSPTATTASDSTSKSTGGEPGEGGDSGKGEAGGSGGRAPVDSGPFMRDQRLDVVVEGWKANWKALDQDWKRKRREALRAERRRRGDL